MEVRPWVDVTTSASLAAEIELNRELVSLDEEVLLALLHTHQALERAGARFFGRFGLTSTQFNALMIVRDYEREGISQSDLARRLLVNRASSGSLVDQLCSRGLLERRRAPEDRRAYRLALTARARRQLAAILAPYYRRLGEVFSVFPEEDKRSWLDLMSRLRQGLRREAAAHAGAAERR